MLVKIPSDALFVPTVCLSLLLFSFFQSVSYFPALYTHTETQNVQTAIAHSYSHLLISQQLYFTVMNQFPVNWPYMPPGGNTEYFTAHLFYWTHQSSWVTLVGNELKTSSVTRIGWSIRAFITRAKRQHLKRSVFSRCHRRPLQPNRFAPNRRPQLLTRVQPWPSCSAPMMCARHRTISRSHT